MPYHGKNCTQMYFQWRFGGDSYLYCDVLRQSNLISFLFPFLLFSSCSFIPSLFCCFIPSISLINSPRISFFFLLCYSSQVSQPRRIAASSLMKHVRTSIGMKVGLRMGNGVKDENEETVIHFATCGYMLRLMSHHPSYFSEHTHIIIDEVHERSVEIDMLCMVTRRLMHRYSRIRLILMSATMQPDVFVSYYADIMYPYNVESIFVGVRRYPVKSKYLEDVLSELSKPLIIREKIKKLIEISSKCSGHVEV